MDERAQQTFNKLPGLANIPILGVLFKSRDRRKQKTEMVVIVTPETISPLNPGDPKPYPKFGVSPIPDSQPALHDLTKVAPSPATPPAQRQ
jgi:Flp pilus assembly secretin CpaC